jgi:hypothetical protein
MNDLRDRLLLEDGIDPTEVSERELTRFRTLLTEERKRARRLSWLVQLPLWEAALLLLGICVAEGLWDRMDIPFLAAGSLAIIIGLLVILAPAWTLVRRLEQAKSRIGRLKSRLPEYAGTRPRGIPLLAREGSTRFVFWPGALLVCVLVGVVAAVVGNVIWVILTGKMSASVTAWQIALGVLLAALMVRHGLTRPPDDLTTLERPGRFFWIAVPRVLTLEIPQKVRLGAAGCMVAILGIAAVSSFFQSGTVQAQVLSALRQARSIHAVGYGFQDGRTVKQSEIWHERGVGTKIQWRQGERTIEMYDNGRDRYEYVQTSQYAVKKPGQGQLLPRELTDPLRYLQDARRDASRDRTIDGVSCLCYERQDPNTLSLMWIDEAMQFRRYEEYERTQDQWEQVERVEIDYNKPVELSMPPEMFERRGIRIVEPAQVLETRYGEKNAIASTEVLGLLFSVHELYRCADYLLVASSLRPTEQTLDELGKAGHHVPLPDPISLGGFDLCSWWQRKPDGSIEERPYAIRELGHLSYKGVDIRWHALLARGQWPGQQNRLEVCAYVRTDDPLRQWRQRRGLDWRGQFRPLATVAIPAGQSDLAALAADLYELGHAVTAVGKSAQDLFVSESSGVTLEQFRGRLESLMAGLRPMGERWDRSGSDLDVRLVDEQGTPVAGAWLGPRVRYSGGSIHPQPPGPDGDAQVSDEAGRIVIPGERLFNRNAPQDSLSIVYAVHPGRRLVACRAVGGDDFGSPVQVIMRPACLVRMVLAHPEPQDDDDAPLGVDLSTSIPRPYSLNRVILDVVRCSTREPSIEIPLPPGEYELRAYAAGDGTDRSGTRRFTVPANTGTLDLGTVELRAGP